MAAGLGADLGVAAAAFVGTNVDNAVVAMAMVAGAPLERARRIAAGQVVGFVVLVVVAAAARRCSSSSSRRPWSGSSGWCRWPSACGAWSGWPGTPRVTPATPTGGDAGATAATPAPAAPSSGPSGRSFTAAALVTIAAGGDNLAVYIPLFRVGGATNIGAIAAVFVVGEALVTWLILAGGRHPKARGAMLRVGHVAVPILLCCVGVLVLVQAGTFSLL